MYVKLSSGLKRASQCACTYTVYPHSARCFLLSKNIIKTLTLKGNFYAKYLILEYQVKLTIKQKINNLTRYIPSVFFLAFHLIWVSKIRHKTQNMLVLWKKINRSARWSCKIYTFQIMFCVIIIIILNRK